LTGEPRELDDVDEAFDLVHAAFAHQVDVSPNRTLILDRASLRWDWTRRLRIEIGDDFVAFSFPDDITRQ
jgi:hypothetical protein